MNKKIVIIGDTHREEHNIEFPHGDILIHTGDYDIYEMSNLIWLNEWFGNLDFKQIICIAGNHETYLPQLGKEKIKNILTNAIYLEHEYLELEGLKIFGSPYTPEFFNWAFMYPRCSEDAKNLWKQIPKNLDILITHGPPYNILDVNKRKQHCGCEVLEREVFNKKPKNHVFGHIHTVSKNDPKYLKKEGINFYNVSLLNENYELVYKPTVINI